MMLLVMTSALSMGLAVGWFRRSLAVVTVSGDSMAPTYSNGDRVLVRRKALSRVRRGEIVLVERPGTETGWAGTRRRPGHEPALDHQAGGGPARRPAHA